MGAWSRRARRTWNTYQGTIIGICLPLGLLPFVVGASPGMPPQLFGRKKEQRSGGNQFPFLEANGKRQTERRMRLTEFPCLSWAKCIRILILLYGCFSREFFQLQAKLILLKLNYLPGVRALAKAGNKSFSLNFRPASLAAITATYLPSLSFSRGKGGSVGGSRLAVRGARLAVRGSRFLGRGSTIATTTETGTAAAASRADAAATKRIYMKYIKEFKIRVGALHKNA